jgi:molybdopterin synthase catalytic subunit
MAIKVMQSIVIKALAETAVERCYLVHRVGVVEVGQPSILVACSSKHRRDAHATVLDILDQVKAKAPIWKRPCSGESKLNWSENSEAFWLQK